MFGSRVSPEDVSNVSSKPKDEQMYRVMAERKLYKLKVLQNMKMSIQATGNINITQTLNEVDHLIMLSEKWGKAQVEKDIADAYPSTIVLILCPLIICHFCNEEIRLNSINKFKYNSLRANKDVLIQQLTHEVNMYSNQQLEEHISLLTKALQQKDLNEIIAATITTNASETAPMQGLPSMLNGMMMNNSGMMMNNGGMMMNNNGMMMNNGGMMMNSEGIPTGYTNHQIMNR